MLTLLQALGRERQQLRSRCSDCAQQMPQLLRVRAQLAHRRTQLLRDLACVYPIVQISPADDFSISNVWVPDAQLYSVSPYGLQTPSFQQHVPALKHQQHKLTTAMLTSGSMTPAPAAENNAGLLVIHCLIQPLPGLLRLELPA